MKLKLLRNSAGSYSVRVSDDAGYHTDQVDFHGANAEALARKFVHDNTLLQEHKQTEQYRREHEQPTETE